MEGLCGLGDLAWPGGVRPAELVGATLVGATLVGATLVVGATDGPADADGTARTLGVVLTSPVAPDAPLLAVA